MISVNMLENIGFFYTHKNVYKIHFSGFGLLHNSVCSLYDFMSYQGRNVLVKVPKRLAVSVNLM